MSIHPRFPGAAPVGTMTELAPADANLILAFRLWSNGPPGQEVLWNLLAGTMGAQRARHFLRNFERLMALCDLHGRRPLMHHGVTCDCAGGDECCLAQFVSTAATGAREDALMIGMLFLRADIAPCALLLATQIGLAIKDLDPLLPARPAPDGADTSHPTSRLH